MKVPIPLNEEERLRALRELNILDTPPEERFDAITRLAQRIFGVPIALVSIVDADRQWFKSKQGLAALQTPRETAFCAHAILGTDPLVVPDATMDPRFQDNPLVTSDPNIRFYAGHPLSAGPDLRVGTLCVIDRKPRTLAPQDLQTLADLATIVERELNAGELGAALTRTRQAEERLSDFMDNAHDLVQMIGPAGEFLYVNHSWLRVLGYEMDEQAGLTIRDVLTPESAEKFEACSARILSGERLAGIELEFKRQDGSLITVEGNLSARFERGKAVYTRGIFRDVSERRRVERMKDEALAFATHEIRGPVAAIQSSLEMLASGEFGELPPTAANIARIGVEGTDRLLRLVNDYLDVEKLSSGRVELKLEAMDAAQQLQRAVEAWSTLAGKSGITFEVDAPEPLRLRADPDRLQQVLANFISNAVKFSPEGSTITLSARRDGKLARLGVRDRGPGIAPEFAPKLFGRFSQDERTRGKWHGSGLGLSIAKAIAAAHGGEIGFVSPDGGGTEFFVSIPSA